MNLNLGQWGPLTLLVVVGALIVVVVGGVICIVHPASLDFAGYLRDLAIAVAGLGVGKGFHQGQKP